MKFLKSFKILNTVLENILNNMHTCIMLQLRTFFLPLAICWILKAVDAK